MGPIQSWSSPSTKVLHGCHIRPHYSRPKYDYQRSSAETTEKTFFKINFVSQIYGGINNLEAFNMYLNGLAISVVDVIKLFLEEI